MDSMSAITAVAGLNAAQQMGKVQLAVAARLLSVANDQGQAVMQLLDAATEGMAAATEQVNAAIGQMVDFQA